MFKVQAFKLESQYLVPTVFSSRKITLTMPPRRIRQRPSQSGDEATPLPNTKTLPSTQTLPDIAEGHEIKAFTEIEEVEL
jgi:hypothetical protein